MSISIDQNAISKTDKMIVAVSGGPDSVCLLGILKEAGCSNLVVAHLDHQIRKTSHQDAELVKKLADEYGYTFELRKIDVQKRAQDEKDNLEAIGRDERYRFFRELKDKHQARYIVTAHHADDQVETVLMNILRGCGVEGLAGMREVDDDIWRPLLPYSKGDILAYCKDNKLKFIEESTNNDLKYRRNFLRLKVIPLLKELNPNLLGTMNNNIRIWNMTAEYLSIKAQEYLRSNKQRSLRYRLQTFLSLDELEQQIVLRSIFEEVHGHKQNLIQDHLEQVLKVLRTNISGKQKEFGPGKVIIRRKEYFEILDK